MITAEKQKEAILTSLIEDIVELYSSELNALVKHLIANDVFVPVWYPVSTYPPAIDTPVFVSYLAYGTETEVCSDQIACLKADGKWYWWGCTPEDSTESCNVPITHWMPLPKALQPKPAVESNPKIVYAVCQEGICPVCGGELEYTGVREDDDDGCTYPWSCTKCGAAGKEGYSLRFDGNHYDVQDCDGNEVKILPPQETPVADDDLLCDAGDKISSAVFAAIQALCPNKLERNAKLIEDMTGIMQIVMEVREIPVCRPRKDEEGRICYSIQDKRCAHCTRHKEVAGK